MKVLQSLQAVRAELSQTKLAKSGTNKFAGFSYFELSDFLPTVQQLCAKYNICPVFVADKEQGKLTVYSCEDDSLIEFSVPACRVEMKGANAIQALGAEQTYLRRYCYMAAFEISENDSVDAVCGKSPSVANTEPKATAQARKSMKVAWDCALGAGMTVDEIKEIAKGINPAPSKEWPDGDCIRFAETIHGML